MARLVCALDFSELIARAIGTREKEIRCKNVLRFLYAHVAPDSSSAIGFR